MLARELFTLSYCLLPILTGLTTLFKFQTEILMVEYDRRQAQIVFAERMFDRKLA